MTDMLLLGVALVQFGAVLFLCWWITSREIDVDDVHERFDELQSLLTVVATVLERLPELVPQFSINQNPFQSLIDVLAQRMGDRMGSNPAPQLRDDQGRYDGEEREEEITS